MTMTTNTSSCQDDSPVIDSIKVQTSPEEKPPLSAFSMKISVDTLMPLSPTSAADVYLILDSDVASRLNFQRRTDASLLDVDQHFVDDDISLCCSEEDEMDEDDELFGLSFIMEEDDESQMSSKSMEE